jgi:hypothetical protein
MKKLAIIIAAIAVLAMTSCEKTGGSIVDTKWTFKLGTHNYVMEFTSKSDVRTYQCDTNYNFEDSLQEGTYSKDGDNLTFGGEIDILIGGGWFPTVYHITSGKITGDTMKITATGEYNEEEYTLMKL